MKGVATSIVIAAFIIGGAIVLTGDNDSAAPIERAAKPEVPVENVTIEDGKQIVEIGARGGYQPQKSVAKAGIPTIVRFKTRGTFDCSSFVRIPSMDVSQMLPQSGTTDIDVGVQKVGLLRGSCGMGMYPFEIDFRS